jgi:hypothetical protein
MGHGVAVQENQIVCRGFGDGLIKDSGATKALVFLPNMMGGCAARGGPFVENFLGWFL